MTKPTLIDFPCRFSVKIIGVNAPLFMEEITEITCKHFPQFNHNDLKKNQSQKSNYLALTVTVYVLNQDMLDAFYQEVTKHKDVRMVL